MDALERGRAAYARRTWREAYDSLTSADDASALAAGDLVLLATAAYMVGRMDDFLRVLERAYQAHLDEGAPLPAARAAFFLGVNLTISGELGRASAWLRRAQRVVDDVGRDCAERGYLLMPLALRHEASGDWEASAAAAAEAAAIGEAFDDRDLVSLAVHTQGRALIHQGLVAGGLALMDEAMLAATAGELSPIVTGVVYCGVIAGCEEAFEPRRAREWTDALSRWCDEQPEMVAFSGRCLAHRAGVMQLHGSWEQALDEAVRAQERAERAANPTAVGEALYQQAEIHRLRGNFTEAETAYREAHRSGREPQPGLALVRLACGEPAVAAAAIRRALGETIHPLVRSRLLPAAVEIMLATGDSAAARSLADELAAVAARYDGTMLRPIVEQTRGAVELAEGDPAAALVSVRHAWRAWQKLDAPYQSARARVLVAQACRALGDEETATLELEAAGAVFAQLGAAPDAELVGSLSPRDGSRDAHGLTKRELEVLRLVAAGKSNREIATALVVSEHTVARHLQNIFAKLRVSSRVGATAFAFEHQLL